MLKAGDVAIAVRDARRSAEWFRSKLGFSVRSRDGHWVTVSPKGSRFILHLCEGNRPERGNTGIGFVTRDVFAEARRMKARGVVFTRQPTKTPWGAVAMFKDPDGNVFWLST